MLKGNGRALAIKVKSSEIQIINNVLGAEKDVLPYTHNDNRYVSQEESDFISEIIWVELDETVLMCAGNPKSTRCF